MKLSENTDKLFNAISKFQENSPNIEKNAKVNVKKNGKFLYSFEYATLGEILTKTKPVLAKHGLSVTQSVASEGVRTVIAHESGQYLITSALQIDLEGDEQDQGSSITYKKRYQLAGALRLDADLDDDGNKAVGNEPEFTKKPTSNNKTVKNDTSTTKTPSKPTTKEMPKQSDSKGTNESTKQKDKEETKNRKATKEENSNSLDEFIKVVEKPDELITRWQQELDKAEDAEALREEYYDKVFKKLESLS